MIVQMSISQCKSIYNFVNRVKEDLQNEAENSLVDVRGETTAGKIVASIFFLKIASISIATIPNLPKTISTLE